jgi:hypothetical protein
MLPLVLYEPFVMQLHFTRSKIDYWLINNEKQYNAIPRANFLAEITNLYSGLTDGEKNGRKKNL